MISACELGRNTFFDVTTKDDQLTRLAERIDAAIRARLGLGSTRAEIADELGHRDTTTLSKWASGAQVPSAENLMRLPEALQVSAHWLLTGNGPMLTDQSAQEKAIRLEVIGRIAYGDVELDELPVITPEERARRVRKIAEGAKRPAP